MKIQITMTIDPDLADPDHSTGVTAAGFDAIFDALSPLGDNIDVEATR